MDLIAQTETSCINPANMAGLLNPSENKASNKSDCIFAEVFAAKIHDNTTEANKTEASLRNIPGTTVDDRKPITIASLDSIQKQDSLIKKNETLCSQELDDAQLNDVGNSDLSALSNRVASTGPAVELLKESVAVFFQGKNPGKPTININSDTTGKSLEDSTNDAGANKMDLAAAIMQVPSFSESDQAILTENKIEQLQDIMAAFLNAVKAESAVSKTEPDTAQTAATDIVVSDKGKTDTLSSVIEQLQELMAAFLNTVKAETTDSKTATEDTSISAGNLLTTSADETAAAITVMNPQATANNDDKAIENKIDLLKDIIAAFLYSIRSEAATSNTETSNSVNMTSEPGNETIATTNDNGQAIENKIDLLKDIIAAFLDTGNSETSASDAEIEIESNDLTTASVDEKTTSSSKELTQQTSASDEGNTASENKINLLNDILAAFLLDAEHQAAATERTSGNSTAVNDADNAVISTANAVEVNIGKVAEKKGENSRTAFINRIAELLNAKGSDGASITEMISRIQTLAGTAQKKAAIDAESKESVFSASEKIRTKTASAGNKTDASLSGNLTDADKQGPGKSATSLFASVQDGMIANSTRLDGQSSVQSVSKVKIHDQMDMPEQKTSTVNSSTFAEIMTGEAKTSPGIKMQALIDQIAQAKQQMDSDYGRVKITLNPPDLGTVDMEVIVRQNKVAVNLTADHASVQQLLQAHSEEVKAALQRQDMKIDTFQVFLQNNNNGNQQQSNHWASMQGQGGQESAYYANHEESADQSPTDASHPAPSSQGLVSIFV